MSGNALKQTQTNRVSKQDHERIAAFVANELRRFPFTRIEVLPSYAQKADFGNLSIFLQAESRGMPSTVAKALGDLFGSTEFVINDNRVSLAVQGLQVDLSIYPEAMFQTCLDYHSFNTLGGLIGGLADSVGLKLHEDALVYRVLDGSEKLLTVKLSTDWASTLTLLGLDAARWQQGFETLASMFEFVASSSLFQKELFETLEYRDVPAEVRLTVAQEFGKWIATRTVDELPTHLAVDKEQWQAELRATHPGLQDAIDKAYALRDRRNAAREKFNGNLVYAWTGRTGKALGELLQTMKHPYATSDEFAAWVLATSPEEIKRSVLHLHAAT